MAVFSDEDVEAAAEPSALSRFWEAGVGPIRRGIGTFFTPTEGAWGPTGLPHIERERTGPPPLTPEERQQAGERVGEAVTAPIATPTAAAVTGVQIGSTLLAPEIGIPAWLLRMGLSAPTIYGMQKLEGKDPLGPEALETAVGVAGGEALGA